MCSPGAETLDVVEEQASNDKFDIWSKNRGTDLRDIMRVNKGNSLHITAIQKSWCLSKC